MTACPYKMVLIGFTALFALIVAVRTPSDNEDDEDCGEIGQHGFAFYVTSLKSWASGKKEAHPTLFRTLYITCIVLLFVFHFELFSGGAFCRFFFGSDVSANALASVRPAWSGSIEL